VFNNIDKTRKTYKANYVLTTMPLGYLKKHHYELFNPKLPLNKIKAIENLGFGCVNKVFVVFENSVLKKGGVGLQILWRDDIPFKLDSAEKWNLQV
jgi:spermine oxidase